MAAVKLVDLHRQYLSHKAEIDDAIAQVLASAAFIKGPQVEAFEQAFARYLGIKHVISCGSGTDALQVAYMALGIGPGDEVITTPFTFVATVEALVLLGARPVYVDIDPDTYNIDVGRLADAITPKTKAIVPVHLYGQPADMGPVLEAAQRHEVPVIEDAAQAAGARYRGQMVGTFGRMACFSFFPAKNLGCFGDGGAIAMDDDALAATCRLIANHGSKKRYFHERVGINSRLDTLQAAVLLAKLPHLERMNEARIAIAARYDAAFSSLTVVAPAVAPGVRHVYQQYSVRSRNRERLAKHLEAAGVPHAVHYPRALHEQPAFAHLAEGRAYPEAERAAREVLSLPMFPEMHDDEIEEVIAAVRSFVD